jgi:Na+/melibiose symporter-like transporter
VLIAAYMAWNYNLTEARHRDIRAEIDARMAAVASEGTEQ